MSEQYEITDAELAEMKARCDKAIPHAYFGFEYWGMNGQARADLPDVAAAREQLVTLELGVGGLVEQGAIEQAGGAHRGSRREAADCKHGPRLGDYADPQGRATLCLHRALGSVRP